MRYSVYVDQQYAFSLSEGALLEAKLHVGQELNKMTLASYKQLSGEDLAFQNSLRYVALRPRSCGEIKAYLQRKQVVPPLTQEIIKRLTDLGYLDDEAFARSWVHTRQALKPSSRRRLALELRQKQIADDITERVLREELEGDLDVLKELVAKKIQRPTYAANKQKLMQYFARQGFSYGDIEAVLKEYDFGVETSD